MSMSLRDQLLAAGLVNQKQVRDAERQQQRGQQQARHKRGPDASKRGTPANAAAPTTTAAPAAVVGRANPGGSAQSAKLARDLALNRKQQEKAERKARSAQIKQLIEKNRIPRPDTDDRYNFVDGTSIRFIAVDAALRARLMGGDLVVVRHEGLYEIVPAAIAERIRERDPYAVINPAASSETTPVDDAYKDFVVPNDLMW